MATNTNPFYTYSATAGSSKTLQKPQDGGDNNQWGNYINTDLDEIVAAVNALSDKIADASENTLVDFTATGSAVNHIGITNAATGNGPTIEAKGDDTNIDLNVSGKGTGVLASTGAKLTSPKVITGVNDTNGNELIKVTATGSAVNEITVANAATGNGPTLSATGDDTNIDLNIAGKGSGTAKFTSNIIIPDAGNIGSVSDPDAIAIASDGGLTFNGGIDDAGTISAGTIGGNVVFPNGNLVNSEFFRYTGNGNFDITSGTETAVIDYQPFSCTVGNTIVFVWSFLVETFANSSTNQRRGIVDVYQSTSAVSKNATSSLGTALNQQIVGRLLHESSSVAAQVYIPVFNQGAFVATNTTHYLGLTAYSLTTDCTFRVTSTSTRPLQLSIYEFQGDVVT